MPQTGVDRSHAVSSPEPSPTDAQGRSQDRATMVPVLLSLNRGNAHPGVARARQSMSERLNRTAVAVRAAYDPWATASPNPSRPSAIGRDVGQIGRGTVRFPCVGAVRLVIPCTPGGLVVVVGEEAAACDFDAAGRFGFVEVVGDRAASLAADRGDARAGQVTEEVESAACDFDADGPLVAVSFECPAPADIDVGAVSCSFIAAGPAGDLPLGHGGEPKPGERG